MLRSPLMENKGMAKQVYSAMDVVELENLPLCSICAGLKTK